MSGRHKSVNFQTGAYVCVLDFYCAAASSCYVRPCWQQLFNSASHSVEVLYIIQRRKYSHGCDWRLEGNNTCEVTFWLRDMPVLAENPMTSHYLFRGHDTRKRYSRGRFKGAVPLEPCISLTFFFCSAWFSYGKFLAWEGVDCISHKSAPAVEAEQVLDMNAEVWQRKVWCLFSFFGSSFWQ